MSRAPLGLLDAFVEVARTGNLTRAAESMHVTVSALSHRMRQLEERLGERLLARGPRGVSLTVAGRRLHDLVAAPLNEIDRAMRRFRTCADGSLTISAAPLMSTGWLVPRLPQFVAQHPQIRLNLHSSVHLVDFEQEPIDCALRVGRGGWRDVHSEFLVEERIGPVASPALLKSLGRLRMKDLHRAPLLGDPNAQLWKLWFQRVGGTPPQRYVASFDNSGALLEAAVQGLGVALGRDTMAQPLIESGRLVALSRRRIEAGYARYLVFPSRSLQHPGFLAFRSWLYGCFDREPPSLPIPQDGASD